MGKLFCAALLALDILAGDWRVEDGGLRGEAPAPGAREARRPFAAALVGPESGERPTAIEATVRCDADEKRRGANAFVIFDVERDADGRIAGARFAGLFVGGKRAAIGTLARGGRPQVEADASVDVRPGRAYRLEVVLEGGRAALHLDGAEVVAADAPARPGAAGQGLLTLGAARFDDVVVRGAAGAVLFEDRFEDRADGAVPGGMAGGAPDAGREGGEAAGPAKPGAGMEGGSMAGGPSMGGEAAGGGGAMGGTMGGSMEGSMTGGSRAAPIPAPSQPALEGGGYAGGPIARSTPGLDGPLGAESLAVPEDARRLIRRRYMDLLGRGPVEAEVLSAARAGEQATVATLVRSPEFWRNWYEEELFYFLLIDQFRPTGEPLASLPDRLARGETDPRSALAEIVISQYFSARNPGNDTFVTVVMEQVLALKVQEKGNAKDLEGGKKMYDGYASSFLGEKGDSQADVVRIAFSRRAMSERYVERLHRRVVGAEIAPEERARAALRFERAPKELAAIVEGWALSPAYAAAAKYPRAKTDPQWIRTLYADLLGARPDYREFRDTRNALLALADSTPIRRVLGRVVVDSRKADRAAAAGADPKRWVEERFLLLLGRRPKPAEATAFEEALRGHGPRLVLRALVQSKEYQTY
jgi:hypothetical protein